MKARVQTRWLLSFADLVLLLLGFFVLLHAQRSNPDAVVSSISEAFAPGDRPLVIERTLVARDIFMPGEAVFRERPRTAMVALAQQWRSDGGPVSITSLGRDGDSTRFDGWELAAARAAALGRVLQEGGFPADSIEIVMPSVRGRAAVNGQHLLVTHHARR